MRFSLRTALLLVMLLSMTLGWWVVRAERQRAAVAAVRDAGGIVRYTFELDFDGYWLDKAEPWAPEWLRRTFGEDLFITVDGVYFDRREIDDNVIRRIVPKLRRLASLRWLELRNSSITDASLSRVAELTQLERLLIRSEGESAPRTQITDKGLSQLNTLHNLSYLSLGGCTIDGSAFERLGALRRLKALHLRHTDFNDAAAQHLRQFPRLVVLDLWKTRITDAGIRHIAKLNELEELYFWDNELTDLAAPELAKLTRLKVLTLNGTQISDAGVEALQPLSNLEDLRLSSTLVENPNVDAFNKLQDLKVSWTIASDALLERASRLPELRSLDCCECEHITDSGIKHLEKSVSLEELFFPDRRVISAGALRSLQQAKPKLQINF